MKISWRHYCCCFLDACQTQCLVDLLHWWYLMCSLLYAALLVLHSTPHTPVGKNMEKGCLLIIWIISNPHVCCSVKNMPGSETFSCPWRARWWASSRSPRSWPRRWSAGRWTLSEAACHPLTRSGEREGFFDTCWIMKRSLVFVLFTEHSQKRCCSPLVSWTGDLRPTQHVSTVFLSYELAPWSRWHLKKNVHPSIQDQPMSSLI